MLDEDPKTGTAGDNIMLSATYSSPSNQPFAVTRSIPPAKPAPSESGSGPSGGVSLESKTSHLRELRAAVSVVQEQINKELTARMDEDKARDASSTAASAAAAEEAKEEENYGEEVQEEDDE